MYIYLKRDMYLECIKNLYNSIIGQEPNKYGNDFHIYCFREHIQMANEHGEMCFSSLFLREMQTKA